MLRKPELLAPAGSLACAEAAFSCGADAVYAGIGKFNLRAHSPNFTVHEFSELLKLSFKSGKRVYGALNIIPNDELLKELEDTLVQLAKTVTDDIYKQGAFIVSDPGVMSLIQKIFVNVPIHLSTQSGCFNLETLKFWRECGISRVILPRELNLEQIRRLSLANIMDVEIFIHGAMCVSVSGRCLMGAYYNRRHPNLGDCAQPCRLKYKITSLEQERGGTILQHSGFDVEEAENGVYLLNSKDLCVIDILPNIMALGVASFKIEGRNKSAHYVASVVKVYRDALDACAADPQKYKVENRWREELNAIEHRPYTTGFYMDDPVKQELFASKAQAGYRLVGVVKAVIDGRPVVDVKNGFEAHSVGAAIETINVLPIRRGQVPFELVFNAIRELDGGGSDGFGTICDRASSNRLVALEGCSANLRVGDMLRIKETP